MTMKVLTIRIPVSTYSSLCDQAGEAGLTVSAHARKLIEKENDAELFAQFRVELISKIDGLKPSAVIKSQTDLTEILLLLRELAADRNPQILQRVKAKIQQLQN